MKDCLKCMMAVCATLLMSTVVLAQQTCCQHDPGYSSGQSCQSQSCQLAYQTCPTRCQPLVFAQQICPQTTCPPFSGLAARPICNPTWQHAAISQPISYYPPIQTSQICPGPVPASRAFAFNGQPINRSCQGRLSPAEAEAMKQTFANNPNAPLQQRIRNCWLYCDANFPDYPCNGECHQACPYSYLDTCDCDCWPTKWGEVCFCLKTYQEDEGPGGGQ
jgi:hypothetical protein